jgi:hypothetical protein
MEELSYSSPGVSAGAKGTTFTCPFGGYFKNGYLRDVLAKLPTMTNQDDLTPLLPSNWQPA